VRNITIVIDDFCIPKSKFDNFNVLDVLIFLHYLDLSFPKYFQSLNLIKILQLNSSFDNLFRTYSFATVCNFNISYYVMHYAYSRIIKFDKDWNFIKYSIISYNNFMIVLVDNNVKRLFISSDNGMTEIDENLNLVKSVSVSGWNYGLYFNSTSVQLLVASGSYAIINVFNLNLTLIGNITVPYTNNYIIEYNGLLYVSSQLSYMMVLENQIFHHSFPTLCSYIRNFAIDQNGILAITCHTGVIHLYTTNGTYTGQSWQSPVFYPESINFDISGNLVISNYYGLYIFNSEPLIQTVENSNSFTTCDHCLYESKVVLFY
jgi:hypothetical protein